MPGDNTQLSEFENHSYQQQDKRGNVEGMSARDSGDLY